MIGNIPSTIDYNCEAKFYKTQMQLIQMGYYVINPLERLLDKNILSEDAKRKNLQDLMLSDAVFIMPCVPLGIGQRNIEIKLAYDFNLTVVLGVLDLSHDETDVNKKSRSKKVKSF